MTAIQTRFVAFALVLAASGCAFEYGIRPSWMLKDSDFRRLRAGMNAAEVEGILGKPQLRTPFPRLREEVWDYRYFDLQTPMKSLLHFDTSGILKHHTQAYDHEYHHGGADR